MYDVTMDLTWKKAAKSATNGECVEVARRDGYLIRDSKDAQGHVLKVTEDAWHAFLASARSVPGR